MGIEEETAAETVEAETASAPNESGAPESDSAEPVAPEGDSVDAVEPEPVKTPEQQLAEQLEAAQARLRTVSKAYTDLQAEMASFRERVENQAAYKRERRAFELAQTFLEPVQNLKRSLENPGDDVNALVKGLELVLHQFSTALDKLGLEAVAGVGSTFDPRVHDALAIQPVTDPEQDNTVLMVHEDGYAVNGKVLQAAKVIIGKYQQAAEA